jgi:branched-chain amino acid transport system permease protein
VNTFSAYRPFPVATTGALALVLVALPFVLPSVTLASELVVFAVGALSCTFLLGLVGLLSFGQGLFFGTGAYGAALILLHSGTGSLVTILAASGVAAVAAAIVGFLSVRRRGIYFVMLTLAFAQMGYFAMLAMKNITGGENGLTGVPRPPVIAGLGALNNPQAVYAFLAVMCFLVFVLTERVASSPLGSVLRAIRENDIRADALGYDVRLFKIAALAFGGFLAGLAGAMHTIFLGLAPPNTIEPEMSERLVIMAIIGGTGSPIGALIGAGFYVLLADFLSTLWPRWLMIIAFLMIAIVLFLPNGLWGSAAMFIGRWKDQRTRAGRPEAVDG